MHRRALADLADVAAFTSVAVLGMSVAFGLESPNQRTLIIVVAICAGVALASFGEVQFAMSGFICQAVGIMFEAARLVRSVNCLLRSLTPRSIQKLLHGARGRARPPLLTRFRHEDGPARGVVHVRSPSLSARLTCRRFAPVCATINACLLPFYEGWEPFLLALDVLGPGVLLCVRSAAGCS